MEKGKADMENQKDVEMLAMEEHEKSEKSDSMANLEEDLDTEEQLLKDFFVEKDRALRGELQPKPRDVRHLRTKLKCCYSWWTAPMPAYINFPMAVFLMVVSIAMALVTVFVVLEFFDYGPYVIGNAPVWTWAAWVCINMFTFFTIWGILFSIRQLFIRKHYRVYVCSLL